MFRTILTLGIGLLILSPKYAAAQENSTEVSSLYFLMGQESGGGDLLRGTNEPRLEIGLRINGVGASGTFRHLYKFYGASSKAKSNAKQISYDPEESISIFDLGIVIGLCYQGSFLNFCPALRAVSKDLSSRRNSFNYRAFGYGVELEKNFGESQIFLNSSKDIFGQRIGGTMETGSTSTVSFGAGYILK